MINRNKSRKALEFCKRITTCEYKESIFKIPLYPDWDPVTAVGIRSWVLASLLPTPFSCVRSTWRRHLRGRLAGRVPRPQGARMATLQADPCAPAGPADPAGQQSRPGGAGLMLNLPKLAGLYILEVYKS